MENLPKELTLNLEGIVDDDILYDISEFISDYISDTYGFCHKGFNCIISAKIDEIKWDIDEDEDDMDDDEDTTENLFI